MSHYAVHAPFEPDARFIEKYRAMRLPKVIATYASMVQGMDQSLGNIMDHLDALGVAENTVLVFISDNGGLASQGRFPGTHNAPLRSGKSSCYEGGIRVPMIVRWPGRVKPGSMCQTPVIVEDLFSTFTAIAGVKLPAKVKRQVDGVDLTGLFTQTGRLPEDRPLVFHMPQRISNGKDREPASVLVQYPWKLMYTYHDQAFQLYNLDHDIGERNNLANKHADRVSAMSKTLGELLKQRQAQCPIVKKGVQVQIKRPDAWVYRNGQITPHAKQGLTIKPGEEMPLVGPTN